VKRFILTGAPGAGKTVILRQLELDGFGVIEEAATDLIAIEQACGVPEPWKNASFIDGVANLQKMRLHRVSRLADEIQFHDRSVVCTAALAHYLGHSLSDSFSRDLEAMIAMFEKRVFLIRNLGFITPTQARRISFEESLRFERIHEDTYRSLGFELVYVEPGSLRDRVAAIKSSL
jgi:predicted ATPase